jgi:hypothetical protein
MPSVEAVGRAGAVSIAAPGLFEFLRVAAQAYPDFNKEMRIAAEEVAQVVVDRAKVNAAAQPKHGPTVRGSSGRSQAQAVVDGLRARRDRIPTIKLDHKRGFVSASRPNRKRKKNVTMGDVFFGAEFGGRKPGNRTQQFLRHRGRQGYFFWQAVRDSKSFIAQAYNEKIDLVLKRLASGAQ